MVEVIQVLSKALMKSAFGFTNVHCWTFGAKDSVDETFALAIELIPYSTLSIWTRDFTDLRRIFAR